MATTPDQPLYPPRAVLGHDPWRVRLCALLAGPLLLVASDVAALTPAEPTGAAPRTLAELPAERRPVTGLVLGGGGALGLAHIGVLKVLREANVPVDVIAGTSMGALVGGGYAAGHAPDELESLVKGADWGRLFSARSPRSELHWRRKEDDYRFLPFEFGIGRSGLIVPAGAIGGQSLQFYFRAIARPVRGITDLDRLPLPFRSVASDLVTGRAVVLKDVPLELAMRASMSVPGAFTPIEHEGALLVDGGLIDNLPVGVARGMQAERVIAVRVGSTLLPRQQLDSALNVAQQVFSIVVERNERDSIAALTDRDVLIEIDTRGYTSADFDRAGELIQRGEEAARRALDRLRPFAIGPHAYREYELRRAAPVRMERLPVLAEIAVEGLRHADPQALANETGLALGVPLTQGELRAGVERVFARSEFERVDYRIDPLPAGPDGAPRDRLVVLPVEKRWGPQYLKFGTRLESNLRDENRFDLSASHTWTWLNRWGAEWHNEVQIGTNRRLLTELYQPLGPGSRWFVLPQYVNERNEFEVFEGERRVARFENVTNTGALRLGYAIGSLGSVQFGVGRAQVETRGLIVPREVPIERSYETVWVAGMALDTLDNSNWPRSGFRFDGMYTRFGDLVGTAARDDALGFAHSHALTWGRNTVLLSGFYGQAVQEGAFVLGGLGELSGTRRGQVSGSRSALARVIYYRNVSTALAGFGTPVYVGFSLEAGNAVPRDGSLGASSLKRAGALLIGLDSVVGPLYFAWGHTQNGGSSLYLLWGRL
jgi:NTE family protein